MQTNLLWSGIEYDSMENCLVKTGSAGTEVRSTIVGHYEGKIYKVDYTIRTNAHWQTIYFDILSRHSGTEVHHSFEADARGNWFSDGNSMPGFAGCMEPDIPLTPFTNTLPVNRLGLAIGQQQQIDVIYVDLLGNNIRRVSQLYRRISEQDYHYENVPNDFEADIEVDENGFVVNYPQLFTKTAHYLV